MKKIIFVFAVILLFVLPVLAENNSFEIEFFSDFVRFEFEDAHMSIGKSCESGEFDLIEIIPTGESEPDYIYLNYFLYEMLVLFNVEFDWVYVFPEGLPESFTPANMNQLRQWHSEAECFEMQQTEYTVFLPIIAN